MIIIAWVIIAIKRLRFLAPDGDSLSGFYSIITGIPCRQMLGCQSTGFYRMRRVWEKRSCINEARCYMYAPRIVSWRTCFNVATLTRPQVYPSVISRIMGFPYAFHPLRYIVNSRPLSSSMPLFPANFSSRFLQCACAQAFANTYINNLPCIYFPFSFPSFKKLSQSNSTFLFFFFFVFCKVHRSFKRIECFNQWSFRANDFFSILACCFWL